MAPTEDDDVNDAAVMAWLDATYETVRAGDNAERALAQFYDEMMPDQAEAWFAGDAVPVERGAGKPGAVYRLRFTHAQMLRIRIAANELTPGEFMQRAVLAAVDATIGA